MRADPRAGRGAPAAAWQGPGGYVEDSESGDAGGESGALVRDPELANSGEALPFDPDSEVSPAPRGVLEVDLTESVINEAPLLSEDSSVLGEPVPTLPGEDATETQSVGDGPKARTS